MADLNPTAKPRALGIDFWKAASIFGVVWIHCSFLIPHTPAYLDWLSPLFEFCVPVFILFWAYLFERSIQKNGKHNPQVLRRTKGLLIRFFLWSLIYWLIKGDFQSSLPHQISKYWSGYGWPGQYFFVILIQLTLLFPAIRWVAVKIPAWINIGFALVGLVALNQWFAPTVVLGKIGDRPFFYWLVYVFAGIHFAQPGFGLPRIPVALAILSIASIPFEIHFTQPHLLSIGPYLLGSIALASLLIGRSGIDPSQPRFLQLPWLKALYTYVSQNSMAIFCMNPLILLASQRLMGDMKPLEAWGAFLWAPLLSTSIALAGSLGLASLLKKAKLGVLIQNS